MSRKLTDLHPYVRQLCRQFVREGERLYPIGIIITQTHRPQIEQARLYARGRYTVGTTVNINGFEVVVPKGRKVTNARPGSSWHNYFPSLAFDFVYTVGGKCDWMYNPDPAPDDYWDELGALARELGLEWGGSWTRFKDMPHCQYRQGRDGKKLTIKQMRAYGERYPTDIIEY